MTEQPGDPRQRLSGAGTRPWRPGVIDELLRTLDLTGFKTSRGR
ncbi:hypothetical protein [Microbispora sp. CA-102843]